MQPNGLDPIPPPGSVVIPSTEDSHPAELPIRAARLWAVTLAAGIVAGLAAWLGSEACLTIFKAPRHAANSKGLVLQLTDRREVAATDARNAGLAFALLGAALGLGLGVAGGLARGCGAAAARAGLLGLVAGAAAGAGTSLAFCPAYNSYKTRHPDEADNNLAFPFLIHAAICSAVGASGGLAFGLGLGARRAMARAVYRGIACAAVGAVGYELINVLAFPTANTTRLIPEMWQTRLVARLGVAVLVAAGVAASVQQPRTQHTSPVN